jgi:uncharacterized protein (DUF2147 family)
MYISVHADQLSITIQDEASERQRKEKERNHLVSIGLVGFQVSTTSAKHKNGDYKDARRGNMVVLDVRSRKQNRLLLVGILGKTIFDRHCKQATKDGA